MPIVLDLADGFKSLLDEFNRLSPEAKKMSVAAGILVGALGPLLTVLGSILTIVATLSIKIIAITTAIAALVLGILYLVDNFEAFEERVNFDFLFNSIIEGVAMTLRGFGHLITGYNKLIDKLGGGKLGFLKASNEFDKLALNIEKALITTDDYEHDFDDFTEFMDKQGGKLKNILGDISDSLNLGGGGSGSGFGGKQTMPESGTAPVTDAPIQNNPLQNILDSVKFFNEQESLIKVPLYKEGFSSEVDEFTNLMGNISTIQEQLSQNFMSFGNVLQSTFAQALQSSDGFFKSFVEGSKRAMSALLAQLAATLALNALLGGSKLGG